MSTSSQTPKTARPITDRIAGILFDLDGTLIDTEALAIHCVEECLSQWGVQIDPRDSQQLTGSTWESTLSVLFQKYAIGEKIAAHFPEVENSEQRAALAKRVIQARYSERLKAEFVEVPGASQAIRGLAANYPLALVSGSNRADILWALESLGVLSLFKVILGAEDYPRSKPEPDGYLKAMELLDLNPATCLVFEDSTVGIAAARAAGARTIAISSTNHSQQIQTQAHGAIADFTVVTPEWVSQLT